MNNSAGRQFPNVAIFASSLLVAAFAITNQSLWIDEANAALKAVQPSLAAWWQTLVAEKGSDLQMPLYMLYLWAWEKIGGHTEVALRLANVPWLLLAHYFLFRAVPRGRAKVWPLLVIASVNPFLWFYLNEARPYVMQYAGSCLVIYGLGAFLEEPLRDDKDPPTRLWHFASGVVVLGASSMLGMAWSGCAILALVFLCARGRQWPIGLRRLTPIIVALCLLALLALFYLWTLHQGAGGSIAGKLALANLFFVPYELLGFSGLGPGRLELRAAGVPLLRHHVVPVATLGLSLVVVVYASFRALWQRPNRPALLAGIIYGLPPALFVIALGYSLHFRFLGRHFTPLSPLVALLLAVGVANLWARRWRLLAAVLPLLWLASAVLLRCAPRHQKDDYRGAATIARNAASEGRVVWWAADVAAARYYGVAINPSASDPKTSVVNAANLSREQLSLLQSPQIVIASKPDLYDVSEALADYVAKENFTPTRKLPAFTIWEKR